ncbi:Ig-like domain-containing protein [Salinisphaera sp.]|uniref:Ig-like domain-containing protein n=1 Tax=Salinisphaera sp. TaxID=1914330 RepID=UPI0025D77B13|nr:Ig-like domain-containing protein [Salinisphaera sp.]
MTKKRGDFTVPGNRSGAVCVARAMFIGLCVAGALTACSSGDGGDSGQGGDGPNPGDIVGGGADSSLAFSYPLNGQDDVYVKSQIAVAFRGDVGSDPGLTLVRDGETVPTTVERDSNQPNIFRLRVAAENTGVERAALAPNADYSVVNAAGNTLFSFSTAGTASSDSFTVTRRSTIGDRRIPLTEFNPIRAGFSQAVDAGSADLCLAGETLGTDCTVSVTGPNGPVAGRLTVQGTSMTFDPSSDMGDGTPNTRNASDYDSSDLVAGQRYTVAFDGLRSVTGAELNDSFRVTPVAISAGSSVDTVQTLTITGGDGDNALNGEARNVARIASQLIGENVLNARNNANRGGLLTRLAGTTSGGRYNNLFPALLPAGQQFELDGIDLRLGGAIDTPVTSGPIQARLINDGDIYLAGNAPLAGIDGPTLVLLRLDLGISTEVDSGDAIDSLSNGVFNQTVMNVVAAGQAIPQDNGDIKLTALGSFPVAVNRDGSATADFELELTLPNPGAGTRVTVANDATPPRITAQYPSACSYTFNIVDDAGNLPFESGAIVGGVNGTTTLSATEADCIAALNERRVLATGEGAGGDPDSTYNFTNPWADSFPLNGEASILFSEPVDPVSLAGNISLAADDGTGMTVPVNLRAEGASVVVAPKQPLQADTNYTLTVDGGITDLAGNPLAGNFPDSTIVSRVTFTTEPMVVPTDASGQPTDVDDNTSEAVFQTAPFITALTPGQACPLLAESGDYLDGGDTAGRCVGDNPSAEDTTIPALGFVTEDVTRKASPARVYSVASQPANAPVQAYFSKPVRTASIALADGCLVRGSGNTTDNATVAIQRMDDSGQCLGVVDGTLSTLGGAGAALTEGFTFEPAEPFKLGQRYWIVICGRANGDDNSVAAGNSCSTGQTIIGQSGLALNTDPLRGTGTAPDGSSSATGGRTPDCTANVAGVISCYLTNEEQGGPDILMPFTGSKPSTDYATILRALPKTDTNGNGFFDNTPYSEAQLGGDPSSRLIGGFNTGNDRTSQPGPFLTDFNDALGRERVQQANVVYSRTLNSAAPIYFGGPLAPAEAGFLGGDRPIALRPAVTGSECEVSAVRLSNGTPVVGTNAPTRCIPVDLPSGGLTTVTSLPATYSAPTGRLLLRFPNRVVNGEATDQPQRGYIVPECSGTFPASGELPAIDYNYAPCFVAALQLTVNGPDTGVVAGQGLELVQQDLDVPVFGPVAFEQNGRLVISTRNTQEFSIAVSLLGAFGGDIPLSAPTPPGYQTLQLVGPALHGGLSFDPSE